MSLTPNQSAALFAGLLIGLLWLIKRAGDDVRDGEDGL